VFEAAGSVTHLKDTTLVFEVFSRCVTAIVGGKLITRESRRDKEFHFQDWFAGRLSETGAHFDPALPCPPAAARANWWIRSGMRKAQPEWSM
jgi:hypothetical protein